MSRELPAELSASTAKRIAQEYLDATETALVAVHAQRNVRYGVWLVDYRDPAAPQAALDGGGLVVTDDLHVHDLGSVPSALDDLMLALGRWPGAEPAAVTDLGGPRRPESDTDAEALLLLADEDLEEAAALAALAALAAWAAVRRHERGVS
jgi:hypothetical protein